MDPVYKTISMEALSPGKTKVLRSPPFPVFSRPHIFPTHSPCLLAFLLPPKYDIAYVRFSLTYYPKTDLESQDLYFLFIIHDLLLIYHFLVISFFISNPEISTEYNILQSPVAGVLVVL